MQDRVRRPSLLSADERRGRGVDEPCSGHRARDIKHLRMPILFLIVFIDLVGFGLVIPLMPFYAQRFAASAPEMTMLFATFSLMSMLTAPLWGRLSDSIGRRPVLMISMGASAI